MSEDSLALSSVTAAARLRLNESHILGIRLGSVCGKGGGARFARHFVARKGKSSLVTPSLPVSSPEMSNFCQENYGDPKFGYRRK